MGYNLAERFSKDPDSFGKGRIEGVFAPETTAHASVVGLVLATVPIFASILRVPFAAVAPMIVVSCGIAAYAIQNEMFDIVLVFGVVGYVF
jgi:TctA family transporter